MIRRYPFVAVAVAVAVANTTALADKPSAKEKYEQGERAYNLGQFPKAIELFTAAYEQFPEPAFLFNIAQSYRMAGNCKQALFFYSRFLSLKEEDTTRPIKPDIKAEVEGRIKDLEECVKRGVAAKPPQGIDNGQGTVMSAPVPVQTPPPGAKPTTSVAETSAQEPDETGEEEPPRVVASRMFQAKLVSARLTAGAGELKAGALGTSVQPAFAFLAGYPLVLGDGLELDLGPGFSFTPVPYSTTMKTEGTVNVLAIFANAGIAYTVAPKFAIRGDVGAGLQVLTGLEKAGNPFLNNGTAASGALGMFVVRVAASAEYAVTDHVTLNATPIAASYSPAPSGFLSSISSLTTLSVLVGFGYRQ